MCGVKIKSVHSVTVASNLNFLQQCNESVRKANRMMGLIKRNSSFKNKDVILPLCDSFIRPHLEYAVKFWSPHHAKDIAKLGVQRRATKMIPSLRNKPYEESLSHLNHAKDIAKLEGVQRRATKMIPSLRNKSYEERLSLLRNVASEEN